MSGAEITSSNDDASFAKANRKQLLADSGTNIEAAAIAGTGQLGYCTTTLGNGRKEKGHYYGVESNGGTWARLYDQVAFPMNWGSFIPCSSTFATNVNGLFQSVSGTSGTIALQAIDATHGRPVRFTTGSSAGDTSGFNLGAQYTQRQWNPAVHFKVRVQETSNNRFYLGFTTNTSLLSGNDPLNAIGGYMFGKRESDTNWHILRNDGVGVTNATDTGIAITTGFAMVHLQADDGFGGFHYNVETSSDFDGGSHTTEIPSSTSSNSFQATYITTTASARSWECFQGLITSQR